jgi:hypothetical protein
MGEQNTKTICYSTILERSIIVRVSKLRLFPISHLKRHTSAYVVNTNEGACILHGTFQAVLVFINNLWGLGSE